jgi:hypothetical protein
MVKARPHEIETKRPTAIPPDSREVYQLNTITRETQGLPLPIFAAP